MGKRESKSLKKNSKLNELHEPRSKNNDLNSLENSKSCLNDLKKLVEPPLLRSNSTSDESPRWLNFDEILKSPTWPTSPPPQLSERSKLTRSLNFLRPLIT